MNLSTANTTKNPLSAGSTPKNFANLFSLQDFVPGKD